LASFFVTCSQRAIYVDAKHPLVKYLRGLRNPFFEKFAKTTAYAHALQDLKKALGPAGELLEP
jgi:hypothetical protein